MKLVEDECDAGNRLFSIGLRGLGHAILGNFA